MAHQNTYSLLEAGKKLGVGYRRTRQLVASGELKASNLASPGERPIWRVSGAAIAAARKRRAT